MDDDRKNEAIGKTVLIVRYIFYALRMTVAFSLIALIILLILKKPLWLAPIIGFGVFLIYFLIRWLFFGLLIKFGRWSSGK